MRTDLTLGIPVGITDAVNKILNTKRDKNDYRKKSLVSLRENIEQTKSELNCAIDNFNNVTEPKLIDFYIYKIQAEQNKYDQLLCEYKAIESEIF